MNLPRPPGTYEPSNEGEARRLLEVADRQNHKSGRNIEVGRLASVVFTDTVTGTRIALTVVSCALTLTAL